MASVTSLDVWFADVGLTLALVLLVGVLSAAVLAWLGRRAGWSALWVRRTVWAGGTVAAGLLVAQAAVVDLVEDANGTPAVDDPVLNWFIAHRSSWATWLARLLAAAGGTAAMTAVTAVTVLVLVRLGQRWQAAVVLVAGAGASLLVVGFKHLYARDRPAATNQIILYDTHALPSGHALGSTVVLGVLAAVIALALHSRAARVAAIAAAAVLVLLVGVSRLYLAAHWLTDVLTGWLLGGAWLTVAVTALVLLTRRDGAATRAGSNDRPSGAPVNR